MVGKRVLAVAVCTAAFAGMSAGSAFGGEITGNGKWIAGSEEAPISGHSECAYSGRNDENVLFEPGDPEYQSERTQSWGQVVRAEGLRGPGTGVPGFACNPTRA